MADNEIIKVEQLPIIREKLSEVSAEAQKKIKDALSLIVSEETVKVVKTVRADLNKQFAELETLRKQVKSAILAPYEEFEAIYRELIANHFTTADSALKTRILEVEDVLVKEKEADVRAYFEELCARENLDWISFSDASIKVNLSASAKGLRDACDNYIKGVVQDISLIRETGKENAPEMLVEYKRVRNPLVAIRTVLERKQELEQMNQREVAVQEEESREEERQEELKEYLPASVVEQKQEEKILTAAFKVQGTLAQMKGLAAYLKASNMKIETLQMDSKPKVATKQEEPETDSECVVSVQFKKDDGTFGGREYSYRVPPECVTKVGEGVIVTLPERNGESPQAVITRVGTLEDVSESIRGKLKEIKGVI